MSIDLEAISARAEAATPGPWMWDVRENYKQVKLVTEHSGQYYVMDFERWGMQGACPSFQVYDKYDGPVRERGSHGMMRADQLTKSYPGKEHHKGFDDYIDHPDAIFIAHAPEDVAALLAEVRRQTAEIKTLRSELYPAKEIEEQRAKRWEAEKRLLQKTCEQLAAVTAERDALKERTRWIPVSERLPETDGFYNVVMNGDIWGEPDVWSATSCGFYNGKWDEDGATITHWMPLPEAPKEADHAYS